LVGYLTNIFSQERFTLNEGDAQKFRIAKRHFQSGTTYFQKRKYTKAEDEFEKCVEVFPKFAEAYFYLAQIYYKASLLPSAKKSIELAKKNYNFMAELRVSSQLQYFSKLREQKQKLQENLRNLKEGLAAIPSGNDSARNIQESQIAQVEHLISQIEARVHEEIPSVDNIPSDYFYVHGNIFFQMKMYKEALLQYLKTIEINPKHGNAYNNLANLYFMAKKYDLALDYLNQAEANGIQVNPKFKKAVLAELRK
jgi:pentatricopeptide repeat protein